MMKAAVAGAVVVVLSGGLLLWQRSRMPVGGSAAPPLTGHRVEGPVRTAKSMVWKASGPAATVWLCGSFHLLQEDDYPLPGPYLEAFASASTVVMELPPGSARSPEMQAARKSVSTLPAGKTLTGSISPPAAAALTGWISRTGSDAALFENVKPWTAAMMITVLSSERQGFHLSRGMERYFSEQMGTRKGDGFETPAQQWALFDGLDLKIQEGMIIQAIEESGADASGLRRRTLAWREGDADQLAALTAESLDSFPGLKKLLLDDRNASWIPKVKQYLAGTETVMVLVGSGHLAGPGSLVDLLARDGVPLTQVTYQTTRPAEP